MNKKYLKWEFWPFWFFYIPVYVVYLWYSLKARSMTFFSATNPAMYMGGFVDYSKYDILERLPEDVVPKTLLLPNEDPLSVALAAVAEGQFSYPLILKPDKGERGFAVAKIDNEKELREYLAEHNQFILMQRYVDMPLEFGVLYYRLPNEEKGQVNSLVEKSFLTVVGDGVSDLKTLFETSERGQYYLDLLLKEYADRLDEVLPKDEALRLVEIGNHCRGTAFLNRNNLITAELVASFDRISKQIDGFYFGRYDCRAASLEDLYAGKIQVMELNGTNSEPAHIYDPEMPIGEAYKFLFNHWKIIYTIAKQNHEKGIPYMSSMEGIKVTREYFKKRKEGAENTQEAVIDF